MALYLKLVEWKDDSKNTLVYRYPVNGKEINHKSKLTVRESQAAVFVYKGEIADVFLPGQYDLKTEIFPILSKLAGWKYGFQTPITVDIYFVNTRQFTNIKWGTQNPILMRDPEFGVIRVRGFGAFSFRVQDPGVFLKELFGTGASYQTQDIADYLKTIVLSGITDAVGESRVSAVDLAGNTLEFNEIVKASVQGKFKEMGLALVNLFIENMSVPKEVEEAFDQRSKLGILGDKTDVMAKIAAAEAMKDAAKNPGMGGAMMGAGVGMGAGVNIGAMMAEALRPSAPTQASAAPQRVCPACGASVSAKAKFCPECGKSTAEETAKCPSCGESVKKTAKFCPNCGAKLGNKVCLECGAEVKAGAKFCPECGTKQ